MKNINGEPEKKPETDLPPKERPTEPGKENPWVVPTEEPTIPDKDRPWRRPEDPDHPIEPISPSPSAILYYLLN